MCKDKNNLGSTIFNIVVSLISAVGIASIFFAGLVASILTLVYITLILGALALIALAFKFFCSGLCVCNSNCNCIENSNLVASAICAVITSIFALTAGTLATGSLATAILIGAVAFFLVSLIISIAEWIICKICNMKHCNIC